VSTPRDANPKDYDIARGERITRGRMRGVLKAQSQWVRLLRPALAALMRRDVSVQIGQTKLQKYSAFLREVETPASFNVVALPPLRGHGLVVIDPNTVFAAVDALFGGNGKQPSSLDGREFSPTEQRVIRRVMGVLASTWQEAWQPICPLELSWRRSEMHPQFASIAAPADTVFCMSITLGFGDTRCHTWVCMPWASLEPVRDALYGQASAEAAGQDDRWTTQLAQQLQGAEVTLVAHLARAASTVEQLLALQPGDFVELEMPAAIEVTVEGVPVMACHYGTSSGRYALKVHQWLTVDPNASGSGALHV
jgi:flagellar motor switch protein FliM